jgi:hypothetical protein
MGNHPRILSIGSYMPAAEKYDMKLLSGPKLNSATP